MLRFRHLLFLTDSFGKEVGHWDHYKENMYTTVIDDVDYAIKPMNCPGGMLVYKQELHSYKDLPLRVGELGIVHRHEKSGAAPRTYACSLLHTGRCSYLYDT